MEMIQQQKCRKVPVLYYLCRNRQLEHPHFIEVPLVSPDGLYLRDVIEKFDSLRGRGMASMYSWSCKRSYKNAFVWNDLGEDDLILPAHENEYILKGSELVEETNSGRFAPARNINSQNLAEPRYSITHDNYASSTNVISIETKISQEDDTDGCTNTKYKIFKCTHGLADASTQTDEHIKVQETYKTSFLTDNGPVESLTNGSPTCSSDAASSACKTNTLESLMKADDCNYNSNASKKLEEENEAPTNTKIRALLQLITCGSIGSQESQDHNFSRTLSCRSRSLDSKQSSRLLSSSVMLGELDCLSENPRFSGVTLGDKQYFSGSLVETKLIKNDEISSLKRSSSYSANRINMYDSALARTKCIPRSITGSLSKHSRSTSMKLCEDPNSCILSPCISNGKPSNRRESFGENKENVIKIEENLLQERE